ncbi:MAG: DUF4231 domain-containing protein [Bacteroidota bacterium]
MKKQPTPKMTEADYLTQRIEDQIKWYSSKSRWNQKRYKTIKIGIIVISVLIPFLTGLIDENGFWLKVAVGIGGVMIAAGESILSLQKYQENWMEYRKASETLKRERLLFLTQSGPYRQGARLQLLVERIEDFTENENKAWLEYVKTENSDLKD